MNDDLKELIKKVGDDEDMQILISEGDCDMYVASYFNEELFWNGTIANLNELTDLEINHPGYTISARWNDEDIGIHFVKLIKIEEYKAND